MDFYICLKHFRSSLEEMLIIHTIFPKNPASSLMNQFHAYLCLREMDKVLNILVPVYLLLSTKSPIIVVNIFIDGVKYILYFENRLSDL